MPREIQPYNVVRNSTMLRMAIHRSCFVLIIFQTLSAWLLFVGRVDSFQTYVPQIVASNQRDSHNNFYPLLLSATTKDMDNKMQAAISPQSILQLSSLFRASRALLTAVELNLFTTLDNCGSMTNDHIRERLHLHERALPDFTDALVSMKLLERDGNGPTAHYSNSREAACFLVKGKKTYIQELEACGDIYYRDLIGIIETLKSEKKDWVDYGYLKSACIRATEERLKNARSERNVDDFDTSPEKIIDLGFGFWPSRLLISAADIGLFEALKQAERGTMTSEQVSAAFGLQSDKAEKFLDALVSIKMLSRDGEGDDAAYSNTPETAIFLQKDKFETYVGGMLEHSSQRLYSHWADLAEALKTGKAQNEAKLRGDSSETTEQTFDEIYSSPEMVETFAMAMMGVNARDMKAFATKFDFSKYKTLADAGGSTGQLCAYVAMENPHMMCTTLDLPALIPIAERCIKKWGVSDRVKAVSCDFFKDDFPEVDIITMSKVLHDWNLEDKLFLIKKAYDALPEGGILVAIELIIDENRRENTLGLLLSLNMLVETGANGGFDYTHADFNKWCLQVGFKRTECLPLGGPSSAVIAYK